MELKNSWRNKMRSDHTVTKFIQMPENKCSKTESDNWWPAGFCPFSLDRQCYPLRWNFNVVEGVALAIRKIGRQLAISVVKNIQKNSCYTNDIIRIVVWPKPYQTQRKRTKITLLKTFLLIYTELSNLEENGTMEDHSLEIPSPGETKWQIWMPRRR